MSQMATSEMAKKAKIIDKHTTITHIDQLFIATNAASKDFHNKQIHVRGMARYQLMEFFFRCAKDK
jgi:hypothetical protein